MDITFRFGRIHISIYINGLHLPLKPSNALHISAKPAPLLACKPAQAMFAAGCGPVSLVPGLAFACNSAQLFRGGVRGLGGNGRGGGAVLSPHSHTVTHFPSPCKFLDNFLPPCKLLDTPQGLTRPRHPVRLKE